MSTTQLFFGFHGRIGRGKFWLYLAITIPLLMFLVMVFWTYALSFPGAYENGGATPMPNTVPGIAAGILWCIVLLTIFMSGLAVTVKRLHDRDKAWWWIFVFVFAPDVLDAYAQSQLAANGAMAGPLAMLIGVVAFAITVWAFVELGCLRGTVGDNRFGADPLAA